MYTPAQITHICNTGVDITAYVRKWRIQGRHCEADFLLWNWEQNIQSQLNAILATVTQLPHALVGIIVYLTRTLPGATYDHHHYVQYPFHRPMWFPLCNELQSLSTRRFIQRFPRSTVLDSVDFIHAMYTFEDRIQISKFLRQCAVHMFQSGVDCFHVDNVILMAVESGKVDVVATLVGYVGHCKQRVLLPRILERALYCHDMTLVQWVLHMLRQVPRIPLPSAVIVYFVRMCSLRQIQTLVQLYPGKSHAFSDIPGSVLPLVLASAADCGRYSVLHYFVHHTPALWAFTDSQYDTPLHCAARRGFSACVKLLLTLIPCDIRTSVHQHTPLYSAASRGNLETMRVLLEAHADVNARSHFGETVLSMAVYSHCVPAVRLLFKYKANPNIVDSDGHTVLEAYCSKHSQQSVNFDILHLLLAYGATLTNDGSNSFLTAVLESFCGHPKPKPSLVQDIQHVVAPFRSTSKCKNAVDCPGAN